MSVQPPNTTDTSRIDLPWIYKSAFVVVVAFTLVSFITMVSMAIFLDQFTDQQQSVFSSCDTALKGGFGTIVGLLGGKLTS